MLCAMSGDRGSMGWDTSPPREVGEVLDLVPGHRVVPGVALEGQGSVTSSAKAALHHGKGQGPLVTLLGPSAPAPGCWVSSPEEPINVSQPLKITR